MQRDLLEFRVEDVMTPGPKSIGPGVLASEALEVLNSLKVNVLIVEEAGRPVGFLHFQDLLRAGVA